MKFDPTFTQHKIHQPPIDVFFLSKMKFDPNFTQHKINQILNREIPTIYALK
jgi:hypothetical protein